ncbi:MIF4G domain protein [Theileria parva strain Muguga]|uniref:Cell cycle control protein, putative n=1 Tax=Theileria parva TaxID=5875 RepID=Q4N6G8_THEPA|nr:MIF4G domain protein [Theileria parva strain Muguga]EAN34440.1 MIF4G domain protein [Theileria parva strain Muguga]|eukprot:XP_766723.1 cell cycle control protein [Theileria parva strain Muguga]
MRTRSKSPISGDSTNKPTPNSSTIANLTTNTTNSNLSKSPESNTSKRTTECILGNTTEQYGSVVMSRTGGVYVPPFKLQRLQREILPDGSVDYQRQEWERLRKHINSTINKLTLTNVAELVLEMLEHNLIRGRGLFARTWIRAQMASPGFTPIYASFLAVINSKFPEIGELTLKRIILQFRRAYKRNDKIVCQSCVKCVAHLVNQKIAHEILALQLLAILLEKPTDDSVELALEFLRDVGNFLHENCKQGLDSVFDRLKSILQCGLVDKRTQYSIEALWKHWRNGFTEYKIPKELDLLEEEDQITHDIDFLDQTITGDEMLNIFQPVEPEVYNLENLKWNKIKQELTGAHTDSESDTSEDSEYDTVESDTVDNLDTVDNDTVDNDTVNTVERGIKDYTEQELVNLRKTIYLCIMSSLNYEECVHKILKLNIEDREIEVCIMLIDCCAMERTFQLFYSLQAERLCKLRQSYRINFEQCFSRQYKLIHRLETSKLRNVAKFFAHLFYTEGISWETLTVIRLTEEDTTSSGRIFIKVLLQELAQNMGVDTLCRRFHDADVKTVFEKMFPTDSPKNIRFSINFLTAIGLTPLTTELRALL